MSLRVPGVDWGVDWGVKAQGRSVLFFLHNVYIGQWQGGSCVLTSLGRSRAIKTFLHDHLQASGDATNAMKTRNRFSLTGSADRLPESWRDSWSYYLRPWSLHALRKVVRTGMTSAHGKDRSVSQELRRVCWAESRVLSCSNHCNNNRWRAEELVDLFIRIKPRTQKKHHIETDRE